MLKAIETEHNGYKFRSRLEARWAVFFDALEIEYQYEPEGFELNEVRYLPDFYLPDAKWFVEIKPTHDISPKDREKINMLDDNPPLGVMGVLVLTGPPEMPVSWVDAMMDEMEGKPDRATKVSLTLGHLLNFLDMDINDTELIKNAVNTARQARFEYGQKG